MMETLQEQVQGWRKHVWSNNKAQIIDNTVEVPVHLFTAIDCTVKVCFNSQALDQNKLILIVSMSFVCTISIRTMMCQNYNESVNKC